jgi:class 3 adenylate cyclase
VPITPIRVVLCTSPQDTAYLGDDSLLGYLGGLRGEDLDLASSTTAAPEELERCDIAVVLVSQSFLDSEWCARAEVAEYLRTRVANGMTVFPIILSPCEWERHAWIASRQFLPGGQETIEEHYTEPGLRKRLFLEIRKQLRNAVDRARQLKAAVVAPAATDVAAERKLVTALHCALTVTERDGTPLPADDAQDVLHEIVPDFRALCEQVLVDEHGGSIAPTVGNALLVYFGHPVVHEDDSRTAVRAALALVAAMQRLSERFEQELDVKLHVRAGLHSARVVVSGSDEPQGDAGPVAGRLQETADEDGVLISEATGRLVRGFFEVEDVGEIRVAGGKTIHAFRVLGASGAETRFDAVARQGLLPIVGRSQEIGVILDRWKRAQAGHGHIVTISAEAGVGKSRLVHEVRERVSVDEHVWIEARCSPYHQNTPFHPLIVLLAGPWLRLDEAVTADEKLARLETALQACPELPIDEVLPAIAALLSIPLRPPYEPLDLPPADLRRRTIEAIAALVLSRAAESPAVFLVEDVHWSDPSTLEFLETMVGQVPGSPLLMLLAFRPEFVPPKSWMSGDNATQITLGKLDSAEIETMILQITGGKPLPAELIDEITRKTDGFPLFIEDLTRMVIESGIAESRGGEYVLAGPLTSLEIPDTLHETLLARLERLASARTLAQLGATIGREFVYDLLQAVAVLDESRLGALDDAKLKEDLNRLVAAGLLHKRGLLSRARYIFKHALVQEALRQSLLKRERKRYHRLIASVIEERFPEIADTQPELAAYHYTEAGEAALAVGYWIKAAQMAVARSANIEANAIIKNGLALVDEMPAGEEHDARELQLLNIQQKVLAALHGWGSAELQANFARAQELVHTDTSLEALQVRYAHWKKLMVSGQLHTGLRVAAEMYEISKRPGLDHYELEAQAAFTDFYHWLGQPVRAIEHGRKGLALYDLDLHHAEHAGWYGEDPGIIHFTYTSISLWLVGDVDESVQLCRLVEEQWAPRITHTFTRGFLLFALTWNAVQRRDATDALRLAQGSLDFANAQEFRQWIATSTAMKGWAVAVSGQFEEGMVLIDRGMELFLATGAKLNGIFYPALEADLWLRAGNVEKGMQAVQRGYENMTGTDERYFHSELQRCEGELQALAGASDADVESLFETALSTSEEQQAKSLTLRTMTGFAEWLAKRGRSVEGRQRLEAVYSTFKQGFGTADLQRARDVLDGLRR